MYFKGRAGRGFKRVTNSSADPEGGGQGVRTTPGKSQVIWVSIGNKQLKVGPHLEKVGPLLAP